MASHFTKFSLSRSIDTKVEENLTLDEKKRSYQKGKRKYQKIAINVIVIVVEDNIQWI